MKKWALSRRGLLIFGGVFLFGVPAAAVFGGGFVTGGFIGPIPSTFFEDETSCFPATIDTVVHGLSTEVRINPRGVLQDNNPNTFLRCQEHADENTIVCQAGFPNGTIAHCNDVDGPRSLPDLDDRVYMSIKPASPGSVCEIVIEKNYGEAIPACRSTTTSGSSTCNENTPGTKTIVQGPTPTIVPNNACVRLKIDNWSSINPQLMTQAGNTYNVPFTATSCSGSSNHQFTADWQTVYLIDGSNPAQQPPYWNCDVFVKFGGNGSSNLSFAYYE